MPGALDIADKIASAASCLLEHGHPDVAEALRLIPFGIPFEKAMGAQPGWVSAAKMRRRDAALASLARHYGHRSVNDVAGRIASLLARYYATAWDADRHAGRRPSGLTGLAYDFLSVSKPIGRDRIRQLLSGLVANNSTCD